MDIWDYTFEFTAFEFYDKNAAQPSSRYSVLVKLQRKNRKMVEKKNVEIWNRITFETINWFPTISVYTEKCVWF